MKRVFLIGLLALVGCVSKIEPVSFSVTNELLADPQFKLAYNSYPEIVDKMIKTITKQELQIQQLSRKP